jgi:hypothetical protein
VISVLTHLFRGYRTVYAWFWSIFLLIFFAVMVISVNLARSGESDAGPSLWANAGAQAPRWFLFVMGIMWATTNLPVLVANGVTRRRFFGGAMLFGLASSVVFTLMVTIGFAIERQLFADRGLLAADYPLNTAGDFARYTGEMTLILMGFILTGWVVGLLFYRLRPWTALLLLPLAMLPVIVGVFGGSTSPISLSPLLALATVAAAALAAYLLVRAVPIRAKKA